MTREMLIAQVVFDVLLLIGVVLAGWRRGGKRTARPSRAERRAQRAASMAAAALPPLAPPAPEALGALIDEAEKREELVAEAALRARLTAFRQRAAG